MLRAGYSSNMASQFLERAAGALSNPGATLPDGNVLTPFSHGMANLNLNGVTTVTLGHGFGLYGSAERSQIVSSSQDSPLNSSYFTTAAGVTYTHKFQWGNFAGEYAREFGAGSLLGESGTIQGQHYVLSAQRGSSGGLQFDLTIHGSDQSVHTTQPLSNRSFSAEASVSDRVAGSVSARLGGGWQWGSVVNAANEFRTNGYTARVGIEHPRLQLTASLNNSLSNSLPFYNQLYGGLGLDAVLVTTAQVVPSDYRAMSFTLHSNPMRKVEISASLTRSTQHLDEHPEQRFRAAERVRHLPFQEDTARRRLHPLQSDLFLLPRHLTQEVLCASREEREDTVTMRRASVGCLVVTAVCSLPTAAEADVPARGRVQYLRTIPSVREFTKPRGFFSKLLTWVAGAPEDKPEITRPYSTTQDSAGRLLVADPGQRGVHIYDFEKHKYQFLKGPRGNTLESPIDIACDTNDDIYVTDSARRQVYVFNSRGRFLRSIGGSGPNAQLQRPTGMVLDRGARRLYLADTLRHQVLVFGLDGRLIRAIGARGAGPGEFNFPTALTLSTGKLYVVDAMNFRVQVFTPDGRFLNSFGKLGNQTGTLNRPKGIAADSEGNLYIADALFETVQIFDPEGRLLYYFGSTGAQPGQFQLPSGVFITDRNIIYVADSLNRRVQVFRRMRPAQ